MTSDYGSFQAKEAGSRANKWLMVNVQNVREFQCQVLNRDVWSHAAVRSLVQTHFILWQVRSLFPVAFSADSYLANLVLFQVYSDSEEGKRYTRYYPVDTWPYVAVLDPQTGQ